MSRVLFFAALGLLICASPGAADKLQSTGSYLSGQQLYDDCSVETGARYGECLGYLMGIADLHATLVRAGDTTCLFDIPPQVTAGQMRAVYMKWMNEHPAEWHLTASSLVISALIEGFPSCGK
nr:Rap1a/Tai family immunity protein [uncultured Dongia sp.]